MGHPAHPDRRLDQRRNPAVIHEERRLIFPSAPFLLTSLLTTAFITLL